MEFQINYLLWIQNFRDNFVPFLIPFFSMMTSFGQYLIIALTVSYIYWFVDKKGGAFIMMNLAFASLINHILKNIFCIKRPWVIDSRIQPVKSAIKLATGYSFPSGHTTCAVAAWGGIARVWNKKCLWVLMMILSFLVAFSRNFLGVHTLQDVVAAFIIGILILYFGYKIYLYIDEIKNGDFILFGVVILLSICDLIYSYFKTKYDPLALPCLSSAFERFGCIIGVYGGWLLEKRFLKFDFKTFSLSDKILFYIFGASVLAFILCNLGGYIIGFCGKTIGSGIHSFCYTFFVVFLYPCIVKLINNKSRSAG